MSEGDTAVEAIVRDMTPEQARGVYDFLQRLTVWIGSAGRDE